MQESARVHALTTRLRFEFCPWQAEQLKQALREARSALAAEVDRKMRQFPYDYWFNPTRVELAVIAEKLTSTEEQKIRRSMQGVFVTLYTPEEWKEFGKHAGF